MQKINSLNANFILKKLKKALKISTDIQLSEFLNIKPNTISTWKKRNSLDYGAIIAICDLYEIDLNEIFLEKKVKSALVATSDTPLVSREVQFQYCMDPRSVLENLPTFSFPFIKGVATRAFQVFSNNMFPIIEENAFVICEQTNWEEVAEDTIIVAVSRTRGIFLNRAIAGEKPEQIILRSENPFFNDVNVTFQEIDELWQVKSVLSYHINANGQFSPGENRKLATKVKVATDGQA